MSVFTRKLVTFCILMIHGWIPYLVFAREVDNFSGRDVVETLPLANDAIDQFFRDRLDVAIEVANAEGESCDLERNRKKPTTLHRVLHSYMNSQLVSTFENWVDGDEIEMPKYEPRHTLESYYELMLHPVDSFREAWEKKPEFTNPFPLEAAHLIEARDSIYRGMVTNWAVAVRGLAPVMRVQDSDGNSQQIGSDKVGHMISQGFEYYKIMLKERDVRAVADHGRRQEEWYFGHLTTDVFSNADLAANLAGLQFWSNLTHGKDSLVVCLGNKWVKREDTDFQISKYVEPTWDEALNCSVIQWPWLEQLSETIPSLLTGAEPTDKEVRAYRGPGGQMYDKNRRPICPIDEEACEEFRDIPCGEFVLSQECVKHIGETGGFTGKCELEDFHPAHIERRDILSSLTNTEYKELETTYSPKPPYLPAEKFDVWNGFGEGDLPAEEVRDLYEYLDVVAKENRVLWQLPKPEDVAPQFLGRRCLAGNVVDSYKIEDLERFERYNGLYDRFYQKYIQGQGE